MSRWCLAPGCSGSFGFCNFLDVGPPWIGLVLARPTAAPLGWDPGEFGTLVNTFGSSLRSSSRSWAVSVVCQGVLSCWWGHCHRGAVVSVLMRYHHCFLGVFPQLISCLFWYSSEQFFRINEAKFFAFCQYIHKRAVLHSWILVEAIHLIVLTCIILSLATVCFTCSSMWMSISFLGVSFS